MSIIKGLISDLQNCCFCWSNPNGQGYVKKEDCNCFQTKKYDCDAIKERDKFFEDYDALKLQNPDWSRNNIVNILAVEYVGKESAWFHQNVIVFKPLDTLALSQNENGVYAEGGNGCKYIFATEMTNLNRCRSEEHCTMCSSCVHKKEDNNNG